jgi:ATP-binding cassette subfamily B protein
LRAPAFGLLVLVIGVLQVALLLASARRASEVAQEHVVAQAEAQTYLVDMLHGVMAVKAAGAEDRVTDRFSRLFQRQVAASLRRGRLTALVDTANVALRTAAPLALLWLGVTRVSSGDMTTGTMLAMCALGASFLAPVASLAQNGQRLPLLGTYIARLADVLDAGPEQEPGVHELPRPSGRIEVRNVGFRYAPSSPWVLRGVSFTVAPGEMLAIVGRTGCGKTTLLKLLLGLYLPSEGEILYDGRPLSSVDLRSLRRQLGVVLQDGALHCGSIRDNIAFGDRTLSLERVVAAARAACLDEDIDALPMGYDTPLGEGGGGLSGGQRQRLALARALAHDSAILFLDEATSHLDVMTEHAVEQNLRELPCTRVVIAHRLSTVRNAERIVVLEGGTVTEMGRHAELLTAGGVYAAMVEGSGG